VSRRSVAAVAGLALVGVLAAGCGGSALVVSGTTTVGSGPPPVTTSTASTAPLAVRVYLSRDGRVAAVARTVPGTRAVARAAVEQLLAGPTPGEAKEGFSTAVPSGTALRGIGVSGGVATVDLTGGFSVSGSSGAMRVAQVVYTLTQFPSVTSVRVRVDGRTALPKPQARSDYESVTPRILVESPAPGATVRCPLRITGSSNDFEATFIAELWVGGTKVGSWPVTATSGNGTRGTFDAVLCQDGKAPPGPAAARLVVYEPSAENGRPLGRVEIPLRYG
jgi:germination protein M